MSDQQLETPLIQPEKLELIPEKLPEEAPISPDKPEQAPPKPITFTQMFRFADTSDMAMMVIGSIAAIAAGAVMPFFSFLFGDVTLIYIDADPIGKALEVSIKFWLLALAGWAFTFASIYCWTMSGERQSLRYRKIYYKLLLRQEVHWYDITNPNELATRVTTEITAIQGAIGEKISTLFSVSVMSTFGFVLAYWRNWRLSLVLSATLPLLMLAGFLVMKAMTKVGEKNNKTYSAAGAVAEQAIAAIRTVKGLVGEAFEVDRYLKELDRTRSDAWKYTIFVAASLGFMILVFLSCYALGFWYGKMVIVDYGYNVSDIISTFFCIIMGGGSIGQVAPSLKNIALGKVAIAKIFELIEREPTIKEPINGVQLDRINEIEFKNLEFAYPKNPDLKVLKGISLKIPKDKTTALVGESGSGKSTIVQLVQRFYDPTAGQVLINSTSLKELELEKYRQQIGYVGQQPAMFAMSIKENLLFAKEDATEDEIMEALKQANAYEFVSKMEKGIDTFLGAGGAQISGGQKQRIAIARAILKNPSLFIFDEATSALDRKNQKLIQETLSTLSKNRTTLVIAHRLSSIQRADNILVLNQGNIVEQGTHEQLLAARSYYYDLIKNQIQAEEMPEHEEEEIGEAPGQLKKDESVVEAAGEIAEDKEAKEKRQGAVFSKLIAESSAFKWNYIFGAICAIINGMTFPAFSYVLSNLMAIMAQLNNPFFDQQKTKADIDMYCLGFVFAATLGGLTTFGYHVLFGAVGDNLVYNLRVKAFTKLVHLKVGYFDKPQNNPGAISAKLAQDAYLIHNMTTGVLGVIILNLATAGAGLSLAFYFNWRLSLVVLGLSPFMAIAGSLNMKRMKAFAQQADEAYKQAGNQISDTVCNIRTVKSFGNIQGLIRAYNKKLETPYKIAIRKAVTTGFFQGLSQGLVLVIYGLVFYIAAVLMVKVKECDPADIFISIFAIVFAAVGFGNNSSLMPDMGKAKNAGANIFEIIEAEDEQQAALAEGGTDKTPLQGKIEFRDVGFKYPSRQKSVFKKLTFTVDAGQKVGMVGSSGCGKSTIMQLILRFYEVDSGLILIDGRNIKQYDIYHLRSNFGIVTQQPVLFAGTIQDNIRYNNRQATFEEIQEAATIANAKTFIENTEAGYDKEVGTKGVQISGGQKQRIAIARCALNHPNIYFFDEATSALDLTTEKMVFESLNKLSQGKTTLSIAHRISTIADANKIIVFDQGRIVEEGTYQQLTEQKGYFYRLERGQN